MNFSNRTDWNLAENELTVRARRRRAARLELLDLTVSNPTDCGFHYDAAALLAPLANPAALHYTPEPFGTATARAAVSNYYRDHEADINIDRLCLTTSTSEAYSFLFRLLCNPGEELLVPKPSYPLFEFLADLQDVTLVPYPLIYDHGWQMDFPSLQKAVTVRTRGVVVVHPNNPTGSFVHAHERQSLNHFCREHGLAVIADEVFLDYGLDQTAPSSFASNQDTLTFTLSGVSKISALPQMKVAWIATSGPPAEVEPALARLEVIADTYLSMNAPIQFATPALLDQRKSIQQQLLDRVLGNLAELDRQLALQKTCQRLYVEGGWYAVVRVPVTQTDEELAVDLLRRDSVLVHPGHFYDFPSDGYLILSLITMPDDFAEGVRRLLATVGS